MNMSLIKEALTYLDQIHTSKAARFKSIDQILSMRPGRCISSELGKLIRKNVNVQLHLPRTLESELLHTSEAQDHITRTSLSI